MVGAEEAMFAKINRDVPLPNFSSVMSSAIMINAPAPAVNVKTLVMSHSTSKVSTYWRMYRH